MTTAAGYLAAAGGGAKAPSLTGPYLGTHHALLLSFTLLGDGKRWKAEKVIWSRGRFKWPMG